MPASQKVRLTLTGIPVSHSLGGGAEHGQCLCIRNRYWEPNAVSNQMPRGSGCDVYARRWCSSVLHSRQRHKVMACVLRLTRMAPVSPQTHCVRPISVVHPIGVYVFTQITLFKDALPGIPKVSLCWCPEPHSTCVGIPLDARRCREYPFDIAARDLTVLLPYCLIAFLLAAS